MIKHKRIGLLFAGQGAQYPNMGKDVFDAYPFVKEMYHTASHTLGYDIANLCFEENALLNQTRYTQPAIFMTSCALYHALLHHIDINPVVMAGFSLGEFSALCASGSLRFQDALEIVDYRAQVMHQASLDGLGSMAAVIGLDNATVESLASSIDDVYVANYNCPNQVVVSGKTEALDQLLLKLKEQGARRAIKLAVSGAFHTPIMQDASLKLFDFIHDRQFHQPLVDVILNTTAKPLHISHIKETIKAQMVSPVLFEQSIRYMIDTFGVDMFIEIGPGKVLSGFVQKIDASIPVVSINSCQDMRQLIEEETQ